MPPRGDFHDIPEGAYELLGQRPFRQAFKECRQPAFGSRSEHASKREGLTTDVDYACDCFAVRELESYLPNWEICVAECFWFSNILCCL